jgi:putative colanic acid biosynthesis acetyltransferase WcaF
MAPVQLRQFNNDWYSPGRGILWQMAWFLVGAPLLRCELIPFSRVRVLLLRLFGATIGEGAVIKPGVRVKYPWRLVAGDDCWFGEGCWIDNLDHVRLGSNVCLSQGCYLCTGNHDWSDRKFGLVTGPITIQDGAWVGARAVVVPGVTFGECAIAAAGSVVVKSIPACEIHMGNPASFVRMRRIRAERPVAKRPTEVAVS